MEEYVFSLECDKCGTTDKMGQTVERCTAWELGGDLIENTFFKFRDGNFKWTSDEMENGFWIECLRCGEVICETSSLIPLEVDDLDLSELILNVHENAEDKGFWDDEAGEEKDFPARLMLLVGEAGEAIEAHRNGDPEGVREEMADIFLRWADMCGGYEFLSEIEEAIAEKMARNRGRPRLHGKRY